MGGSRGFDITSYINRVFAISKDDEFNALAMELFSFQYRENPLYHEFCSLLGVKEDKPGKTGIPFIPIEFFRDHDVVTGPRSSNAKVFTSSGTTGSVPSRHRVPDLSIYEKSFTAGFEAFYGDPGKYTFLVLLPGYLERSGSSLVYMMDWLVKRTEKNGSGFYLHNLDELSKKLLEMKESGRDVILFGATHALVDLAENYPMDLEGVIIMETGGMKGRRKEMVREELHGMLCEKFHVDKIHSEYGMTELLSQAYSAGEGTFRTPPWMKVLIRDVNDPLSLAEVGDTGGISIIDLANVFSCGFIATQDLGRLHADGSFEVLGRFDNSDIRGCSLMVS